MFERDIKTSNLDKHPSIEKGVGDNLSLLKVTEDPHSKGCSSDQAIEQLIKKARESGASIEFINLLVNEFIKKNEQLSALTQERDSLKKKNKRLKNSYRTLQSKFITTKIKLEKARKLSETDPLTNIYNRRGLLKRLKEEVKTAHRSKDPLVLLLIDGDNFKSYNDNFSYAVGDQVLKHIVNSAKSQIRPNDIIGRLGGEEFVVILSHTKFEDALKIAERIRKSVNTDFTCKFNGEDKIFKPSVSIGLASEKVDSPVQSDIQAGVIGEEIIGKANSTLKEAKATGKNKVVIVK